MIQLNEHALLDFALIFCFCLKKNSPFEYIPGSSDRIVFFFHPRSWHWTIRIENWLLFWSTRVIDNCQDRLQLIVVSKNVQIAKSMKLNKKKNKELKKNKMKVSCKLQIITMKAVPFYFEKKKPSDCYTCRWYRNLISHSFRQIHENQFQSVCDYVKTSLFSSRQLSWWSFWSLGTKYNSQVYTS